MDFIEKRDRGIKTFQVQISQVALIEAVKEEGVIRFSLQGGHASFPKEAAYQHSVWSSDKEFFLEIPESSHMFGHPVRVAYRITLGDIGKMKRRMNFPFWQARKEDFIRSFTEALRRLRNMPEMQDFGSVERAGTLVRLAKTSADANSWPVEVTKIGLGNGSEDPFDAVKDKIPN